MSLQERMDRVNSLLRELAATFIGEEANPSPLITVIVVETAPDLKQATIFVSVFPEREEHGALAFLKRKGNEFRGFVKQKTHLKDIPFFEFKIDYGEKARALSQDLLR